MSFIERVDIGGNGNDPHYRYKRDKLIIQPINKNGGILKLSNLNTIINHRL